MPVSVIDDARDADGRVPAAEVVAQVSHSLLHLHCGKVGVVDPGHVKHQTRIGLRPQLELDDQTRTHTETDLRLNMLPR